MQFQAFVDPGLCQGEFFFSIKLCPGLTHFVNKNSEPEAELQKTEAGLVNLGTMDLDGLGLCFCFGRGCLCAPLGSCYWYLQ